MSINKKLCANDIFETYYLRKFIFHLPAKIKYSFCLSFSLPQAWVPKPEFFDFVDEFLEQELSDAGTWYFQLFIYHHDLQQ